MFDPLDNSSMEQEEEEGGENKCAEYSGNGRTDGRTESQRNAGLERRRRLSFRMQE